MKLHHNDTPVLILGCELGGLSIMRSLGSLGVTIYGVDGNPRSPGMLSRFCSKKYIFQFDENRPQAFLDYIIGIGEKIGKKSVLIPTSDELSLFVAKFRETLRRYFLFQDNSEELIRDLISKEGMFSIAKNCSIPTAHTLFPKNREDLESMEKSIVFPVMLKGIHGNRLEARTGKKMVLVNSFSEMMDTYMELEDPDDPNLMVQEYIPGGDDQIYIFNGYFDAGSKCMVAYTGYKVRQFPIHVGCASLGECKWFDEVANMTIDFMRKIGYHGILDIGYRLDPRDKKYKVLDINPRVGQAFRLFVGRNGQDVIRALYQDLTGQKVDPALPDEGRRWAIEDYDIISSYHYFQEGSMAIIDWVKSFRKLRECAWFSWSDPAPFINMASKLSKRAALWAGKQIGMVSR